MGGLERKIAAMDAAARRMDFVRDRLEACLANGEVAEIIKAYGEEPDWKLVFIEWFENGPDFQPDDWLLLLMVQITCPGLLPKRGGQ